MAVNSKFYDNTESAALADALTRLQNRCLTSGGAAIGTTKSNLKLANAVQVAVNGKIASVAAGSYALTTMAVNTTAAGYARLYLLCLKSDGTAKWYASDPVLVADKDNLVVPDFDTSLYAAVGAVRIANAGASAAFTPGTTLFDASDITATYYNLSGVLPGQTLA